MWWKTENDLQIDIQPRGEQDKHIASVACECVPILSESETRKLMIIHRTFDGARGFERAGIEPVRRAA